MRLASLFRFGARSALAALLALSLGLGIASSQPRDQERPKRAVVKKPAPKARNDAQRAKAPVERKRDSTDTSRIRDAKKGRDRVGDKGRETAREKGRENGREKRREASREKDRKSDRTKTADRGKDRRAERPRNRVVNAKTAAGRQAQRVNHHAALLATRRRLPVHPLPGERGFTGVPPAGETRFVSTELVFQAGPNVTQQQIDDMARRHNCVAVATQRSTLTGGTLIRFRIAGTTAAADMVRAMEAEQLGVAQPNYIFETTQSQTEPAQSAQQYVVDKLKLAEVHKIATGKGVLIAIIDSQIDVRHPEYANAVADSFDAVGQPDKPHPHGTGMLGAIVERSRLMGIAPDAKALAIHAFATGGKQQSAQATTQSIIAGLEWALSKGARIINMSFAGPHDPMLQLALKRASERGAILIAAVGNNGPTSPPLYPAADEHVIGVTATDENDDQFADANRGAYVTIAAPGVHILAPAPEGTYQLTTGTSVAAAHVSGVAALLLERHPEADAATILDVLTASAVKAGANGHDDRLGWGLIDPKAALAELDSRLADGKVATNAPAKQPASAPTPKASPAKSVQPRPSVSMPR